MSNQQTIVSLNALPPQVLPPLANGATGIGSSAIIHQNQATQQQMALIGSGIKTKSKRMKRSKRRSKRRNKRKTKKTCQCSCHRSAAGHKTSSSRRRRSRRSISRRRRNKMARIRGGTPVALVPPVSPGAVNAAATANMYKQLTEVANTQAIQSRFDVAKTPQDTAALEAQQQALYNGK